MNELSIPGEILIDTIVPPRTPWSGVINRGQVLRLIDLEGQQAVDFLCFNKTDPSERYHAANTIKVPRQIFIGQGSILRSSLANAMMTVISDTCGKHDTIFGCCSFEIDQVRYGKTNEECCQRNFERELAGHGIGPEHIVPNVNFFMYVPVDKNGDVEIKESLSKPGDYVDLRAEMDLIAVLSNCPEALNPATGASGPTPIRVIVYQPQES